MKCYKYDYITKIYTYEDNCQLDPLESELAGKDIYLLPAFATYEKPLKPKEGFNVVFNENENKWEYIEIPKEKREDELKKEFEDSLTEEQKINIKISKLQSQLYSTDWYVTRYSETGKEIPQNIRDERESLRNEISKLKDSIK